MDNNLGWFCWGGMVGMALVSILGHYGVVENTEAKPAYTHLCKEAKEHVQTNMTVWRCIENE